MHIPTASLILHWWEDMGLRHILPPSSAKCTIQQPPFFIGAPSSDVVRPTKASIVELRCSIACCYGSTLDDHNPSQSTGHSWQQHIGIAFYSQWRPRCSTCGMLLPATNFTLKVLSLDKNFIHCWHFQSTIYQPTCTQYVQQQGYCDYMYYEEKVNIFPACPTHFCH